MSAVGWLVIISLMALVYGLYEALVWPMIDMTEQPKLRRPWSIRRWLDR